MTLRRWVLGTVAVATLASGLIAAPGVVTHRDGNTFTGDVSEDQPGKVIVKVRGIPIVIDRSDVVSIKYTEPEDFQKKLENLPKGDFKAHMDLAKWAYGQRRYDWVIEAAEAALQIDPNSREATDMIIMARRQRELERAHPAGDGQTAQGGKSTTTPAVPTHKTLTPDDINLIRQNELRDREDFRVQFLNDVRRKYCEANKLSLAQFMARPVTEQAREIIRNAPELRNDVRISTDPASILQFKRSVQPALIQGCATAGCHSGQTGGGFVLLTNTENEAVAYTNFHILNTYVKKFGPQQIAMIERTQPERSLLLQFGLPGEDRPIKHPAVPNYRPIYRTPNDPRFLLVARWLGESLTVPAPDYSAIQYEVPKNPSKFDDAPTTAPSN